MLRHRLYRILCCLVLLAVFHNSGAQGIQNLIPVPAEVPLEKGEYRFEGEPKVKYVTVAEGTMPAESYRLKIDRKGVTITSADPAGAFYAQQTLAQLIEDNTLPYCVIYDYPRDRKAHV